VLLRKLLPQSMPAALTAPQLPFHPAVIGTTHKNHAAIFSIVGRHTPAVYVEFNLRPAGVELLRCIHKDQFPLNQLQLKGQTAPAIWNAVLARKSPKPRFTTIWPILAICTTALRSS
jgi:hypothetical protein